MMFGLLFLSFFVGMWALNLPVQLGNKTVSMFFVPALFGEQPVSDLTAMIVETVPADGCGVVSNMSADGRPLAGKIALVYASNACLLMFKSLAVQAAGAAAVLFYSCSIADFCVEDAFVSLGLSGYEYKIPTYALSYGDGSIIRQSITDNSVTTATFFGSGNKTLESDLNAIVSLYQTFRSSNNNLPLPMNGFNSSFDISGSLQTWEKLLDPSYDPCTLRLYGVLCHNGRIVYLNCYGCGASGQLPDSIGLLTALVDLDFSIGNSLTGVFPCTFGDLQKLELLIMSNNAFTTLQECVGTMVSLTWIDISTNQLTSLPNSFSNFILLRKLVLNHNAIVTTPPLDNFPNLTVLDLGANKIMSNISLWKFTKMPKLILLDIHSNFFNGSLDRQQLDGLNMLTYLDLSKNRISLDLPDLSGTTKIVTINVAYNSFSGVVPSSWGLISTLKRAHLSHNQLISPVTAFRSISLLEEIDLSFNLLTCKVADPTFDGDCGFVLTEGFSQSVKVVNLANNRLSGVWNSGFFYFLWANLISFSVANNLIGGVLPSDIWTIISPTLLSIDFSGNLFTGSIPSGGPTHGMNLRFDKNPQLSNVGASTIPTFLVPSSSLLLDSSSQFGCPILISIDSAISLDFSIDPSYYQFSLCTCQRGYTYFGAPPNCTAFPSNIYLSSNLTDSFTDGASSGRLRNGVDTTWLVNPGAETRAIWINLRIFIDKYNRLAEGKYFASYILSVADGNTNAQIYYFNSDASSISKPVDAVVLVLSSSASVRFLSNSQTGPIFQASYNASIYCPQLYVLDSTVNTCVVVPTDVLLSEGAKTALLSIISILICLACGYGIFLMYHIEHRIIHAASPAFCLLFLFGGVLLLFSALLRGINFSPSSCTVHTILVNIGFSVSYGSLFSKTWRLHKIFNNKDLAMTKITNNQLFSVLGLWVFIDLIIVITWMASSPYTIDFVAQNCVSKNSSAFSAVIICLRAVQISAGAYITFQVRGLPSQFNESRFLAISTYNVITLSALYLAVNFVFASSISYASATIFESGIISLGAFSTISVVLLPKFYSIYGGKTSKLLAGLIKSAKNSAPTTPKSSVTTGTALSRRGSIATADALKELELIIKTKEDIIKSLRAKSKQSEENMRKAVEDELKEEASIAEAYAEIEYIKDVKISFRRPSMSSAVDMSAMSQSNASGFLTTKIETSESRHSGTGASKSKLQVDSVASETSSASTLTVSIDSVSVVNSPPLSPTDSVANLI